MENAQLTAAAIALAFNTQNTRKVWSARSNSRDNIERVHFTTETGMVKLVYDCRTGTFNVQFNKVQAAWGDYVRAIARAFHVVCSTLKSAGLPFDAPDDDEGVVIRTVTGIGGAITVAYEPPPTVASAIMPELVTRPIAKNAVLAMGYSGGSPATIDPYQVLADNINNALMVPTIAPHTDVEGDDCRPNGCGPCTCPDQRHDDPAAPGN